MHDRECAVAAVDGVPLGSADGRGAVAPSGSEPAVVVPGVQDLQDPRAQGCCLGGRVAGVAGGVRLAGGVCGRAGERSLDERQGGQSLAQSAAVLGEFEQAAAERCALGLADLAGRGEQFQRALARVDF